MVRILISLSSTFQSYQWKSVFPKVLKWLSYVFQGLWAAPVYWTIIKNAASCIHLQCPLEKCTFTWGGVQVISFVQWKDTIIPCSLKGSVVMAAVKTGWSLCTHRNVHQVLTVTTSSSGDTNHCGFTEAIYICCLWTWPLILTLNMFIHHSGKCIHICTLKSPSALLWIELGFQGWALILPEFSCAAWSCQLFSPAERELAYPDLCIFLKSFL